MRKSIQSLTLSIVCLLILTTTGQLFAQSGNDDPRPQPKTEPKIEPKIESKAESKAEAKAEAKPISRFVDHGAYVEDLKTGLYWQKDGQAAGKLSFYQAADYAKELRLGGLDGWRVPSRKEIETIFPAADLPFVNSGYNPDKCCNGPQEFRAYWTGDLDLRLPDYAYAFQWYDVGGANNCSAKGSLNVRCVRRKDGTVPPPDTDPTDFNDLVHRLLALVGNDNRDASDRAILQLKGIAPAIMPTIKEEYDRQKRRLAELEILLADPKPRR